MRRKVSPKKVPLRDTQGNDNKVLKPILKPTKTPTGKGLGKAGAKRLGRLLKRAIHFLEEEPAVKGKVTLPKTPVRLFKHQVQKEAENSPHKRASKPASADVSLLIVSLVSQCKHQGGISMADLKNTLATEGYNVTKNNKQVNLVTKRLINNETLVRTTRNALRLNNKNDTTQARKSVVTPKKPKEGLVQNKRTSKSSKAVKKSQRPARKTPKDRGKTHKPKGKTKKKTAKPQKTKGKTRRPPAKSHRRRKTARARRKIPKQTRRKRRTTTKRAAPSRKAPNKKIKRARRRQPKQNRHPRSSRRSRKTQRNRAHKTGSKRPRSARRRVYYYED